MNQWTKHPVSLWDRFHQKIEPVTESGCWIWTGQANRYGAISIDGIMRRAHRVAWELYRGPILDGLEVCHSCDVGLCVNPSHLFLGTHKDNCDDRDRKGRNVNPAGSAHGRSKLTENDIEWIRLWGEYPHDQIAVFFGVTQQTISSIVRRETWKHVE